MDITLNLISLIGIYVLCLIAWLSSENKKHIPWKVISWGLGLQFFLGLLLFVVPITRDAIVVVNDGINLLLDASEAGARFVFGGYIVPKNAPSNPGGGVSDYPLGYVFAFRAMPMVIFFSALINLLYRLNLIQPVVKFFAKIFQKSMGISGAESLAGAANIFVGIESAIAIKPYLPSITRSELCAILASCFGSIASTVLGIYANALRKNFPSITGHLMAASVLTIPACFVISKLIIPEDGRPVTMGGIPEDKEEENKPSIMDTFIKGAIDGVGMAVGISAVLIGMLAVIEVLTVTMNKVVAIVHPEPLRYSILHYIFGGLFFPLTFLTGVSLNINEIWTASVLIGQRFFINAIPSYNALPALNSAGEISDRTMLIVSYVLCGFASLSSVGIFVGGVSNLVPERAKDVSSVAWKALWAATLATLMTGCVAGLFDFGNPSLLGK